MPFTPIETFFGGVLLHLSTSSLLSDTGRVFGISGIVDGAVFSPGDQWRWAILAGLLAGPALGAITGLRAVYPGDALSSLAAVGFGRLIVAGGLVGFGTRLASGCTSGHMLCGASRLSPRSLVATAIFFTTAVVTASLAPAPFAYSANDAPALDAASTTLILSTVAGVVGLSFSLLRRYLKKSSGGRRLAPYFLSGLVFSLGLQISGMADPRKVYGFLRVSYPAEFDPSLVMVMLGGLMPNAIHYALITEHKPRYPWESWRVPNRRDVDWRLGVGALAFGVGWGLVGVCPGPIIVSLGDSLVHLNNGVGFGQTASFIGTMLIGMGASRLVD